MANKPQGMASDQEQLKTLLDRQDTHRETLHRKKKRMGEGLAWWSSLDSRSSTSPSQKKETGLLHHMDPTPARRTVEVGCHVNWAASEGGSRAGPIPSDKTSRLKVLLLGREVRNETKPADDTSVFCVRGKCFGSQTLKWEEILNKTTRRCPMKKSNRRTQSLDEAAEPSTGALLTREVGARDLIYVDNLIILTCFLWSSYSFTDETSALAPQKMFFFGKAAVSRQISETWHQEPNRWRGRWRQTGRRSAGPVRWKEAGCLEQKLLCSLTSLEFTVLLRPQMGSFWGSDGFRRTGSTSRSSVHFRLILRYLFIQEALIKPLLFKTSWLESESNVHHWGAHRVMNLNHFSPSQEPPGCVCLDLIKLNPVFPPNYKELLWYAVVRQALCVFIPYPWREASFSSSTSCTFSCFI